MRQHLSILAEVNLAAVDDEGRWSAVQTPVVLPDLQDVPYDDPDRQLVERMHALLADRRIARMKHWSLIQRKAGWEEWRGSIMATDWTMHMTADELAAMEVDLMDVVRRHRAALAGREIPDDAAAIFVSMFAAPLDALRPTL